jgi:hypothetical protein
MDTELDAIIARLEAIGDELAAMGAGWPAAAGAMVHGVADIIAYAQRQDTQGEPR